MDFVIGEAVKWVDAEAFPSMLEVHVRELDGQTRRLVDKEPVFSTVELQALPCPILIACEVVPADGDAVTIRLFHCVEDSDGGDTLVVPLADVTFGDC